MEINNHLGILVCLKSRAGQLHKVACCPISSECIVQSCMFTVAGKSAIYTVVWALNNGADSMSCILLFPSLWENTLSPFFFWADCKLWMLDIAFLLQKASGTLWLADNMAEKVDLCARFYVSSASWSQLGRFFFPNLTSFIFSCCEITIGDWSVFWPKWETETLCFIGEHTQESIERRISYFSFHIFQTFGQFSDPELSPGEW